MAASKSMTSGKAKKSGTPRMAPKVGIPRKDKPFSQNKAMDDKVRKTSAQQPMKKKSLAK
jgi:hypothetical protein